MLFNSHVFLFGFLPLTILAVALARRFGQTAVQVVFLAASLVFYGWFVPAYLILLIGSVLFNFGAGFVIERNRTKSWPLVLGIAVNLGLLGYFKYAGFLVENFNSLLGASWMVGHVVLPLAISFFTFQQIAYLIDLKRGEATSPRLIEYMVFVTFFPHLLAGPIIHHAEVVPQIRSENFARLTVDGASMACVWFAIGLAKKVLIADTLAPIADTAFAVAGEGTPISFFEAWFGALAFAFQIYFDFSGYTDMAIGLGLLFGVALPLNFAAPYRAASIIDFWRRWHMTLSRFLRDYLYFSLGGNRHGEMRRNINLMITMLLGGLWHGAAWTFVIWGGLHGLYLVVAHQWRRYMPRLPVVLGWALTFMSVCFAWVFFRAQSFSDAWSMIEGMVGMNGVVFAAEHRPLLGALGDLMADLGVRFEGVPAFRLVYGPLFLALLVAALILPTTQALTGYMATARTRLSVRPTPAWGVATGALLAVAILAVRRNSDFIYFQF